MVGNQLLTRLDHIEFIVRDVKEFIEFYKMFGFEIVRQTEHHHGSAELKLPGENQPIIEVHGVEGDENPGVNHVAFATNDIDAVAKLLDEKRIEHRGPFYFEKTGRMLLNFRHPGGYRAQVTSEQKANPP